MSNVEKERGGEREGEKERYWGRERVRDIGEEREREREYFLKM